MKSEKKILYIGNKLAGHGYPPTSADLLPPALEREGYKVLVASDNKNKFLRLLSMMRVTFRNRKKVDVVIIDTYSTWNFYYAIIIAALCRKFKLPYIPILRGGNLPVRLKKNNVLSKQYFNGAKTNVVPSHYLMDLFKKEGYHNLTFVPNSIAMENYPFSHRTQVRPRLLWVRSFAEIYNPVMALKIVEILKRENIEADLCMVGPEKDGSLQKCKQLVIEKGLGVTFTGLLKKEEWIALSSRYDIFINTTNFDNMPISVMEAMALGMPVISTNVGGMPFLIDSGTNGILVPPNNPQAFAESIVDLCQNPHKTKELSLNAHNNIKQYDWENIKTLWFAII